jgi:hypothetical protein
VDAIAWPTINPMNTIVLGKEVIETYFQDFMAFFFPQAHAEINWSRIMNLLTTNYNKLCGMLRFGMRRVDN